MFNKMTALYKLSCSLSCSIPAPAAAQAKVAAQAMAALLLSSASWQNVAGYAANLVYLECGGDPRYLVGGKGGRTAEAWRKRLVDAERKLRDIMTQSAAQAADGVAPWAQEYTGWY